MGPLKTGEELVTDHLQMANMLNDFFCSVFREENLEDIPQMAQQYKGDDPLLNVKFTNENVKEKLTGCNPSAAPGQDKVWAKVLHSLADVLAESLAFVYTKLLDEGSLPDICKSANVCPVFKKGSKGDPGKYTVKNNFWFS